MKILLPIDGSEYTKRMLAYLAAHEELLTGVHEYSAFTVVDPTAMKDANFLDCGSLEQVFADRAEQVLEPVRKFARQQLWNITCDYVPGHAAQAIVAKAETLKPDLIVMGTRGRSPMHTMVLGSVAQGVLSNCKVPLLLIR